MSIVIHHNPGCGTSRNVLEIIRAFAGEPVVIEYLKTTPTVTELDSLLKKLNMEPRDLMRKGEEIYRELKLAEKELSRDEALELLTAHPKLIERPIVVKGRQAVLGRPPENVNALL